MAYNSADPDLNGLRVRVKNAAKKSIAEVAVSAGSFVRGSMPGPGASAEDSKNRGTGQNDRYTASNPGTPPGVRSGELQSSVGVEREDDYTWAMGVSAKYAFIHEYGGTINHPGGTPYIIMAGGATFIKKTTAARLESEGRKVFYTKPHTIQMPRRPFFMPTIRARAQQLREIYARRFIAEMNGG